MAWLLEEVLARLWLAVTQRLGIDGCGWRMLSIIVVVLVTVVILGLLLGVLDSQPDVPAATPTV